MIAAGPLNRTLLELKVRHAPRPAGGTNSQSYLIGIERKQLPLFVPRCRPLNRTLLELKDRTEITDESGYASQSYLIGIESGQQSLRRPHR